MNRCLVIAIGNFLYGIVKKVYVYDYYTFNQRCRKQRHLYDIDMLNYIFNFLASPKTIS